MKNLFFFDIETCGKYHTFEEYYKNDQRGAELFEYKFLKKMKKNDSQWMDNVNDAWLNNSSLYSEYGKIVCLSMGYFKNDGSLIINSITSPEEELIKEAQKVFNQIDNLGMTLCGYNIKGFDIPWLFKKMTQYEIDVPMCLNTFGKKPWEINVLDLMEVWKSSGFEFSNMDEVAYVLGIPSPKKGEVNGSQLHSFYWENINNPEKLKEIAIYCEKDIVTTVEISNKLKKVL